MAKFDNVGTSLDLVAVNELGSRNPGAIEKRTAGAVVVDDEVVRRFPNHVEMRRIDPGNAYIRVRCLTKNYSLVDERNALPHHWTADKVQFSHKCLGFGFRNTAQLRYAPQLRATSRRSAPRGSVAIPVGVGAGDIQRQGGAALRGLRLLGAG